MASAHPILDRLESTIGRYRDTIARLTPELAHLREEKEIIMQFLSEFGPALKSLIDLRHSADEKADAEGKRADTAEADAADLRKQIAADEASLKAMLDEVNAETAAETPSSQAPASTVTTPTPTTTIAVVPAGADPTPVLTAAGTVTVDPGTTLHVDDTSGTATLVPHDGTAPTATDASGASVSVSPAAVAKAVAATVDAGVTVAAPAAPEAAPVI